MAKLLSLGNKFLIGLSIAADINRDLKSLGGFVGKKGNYYTTISRMLKSEVIEKVIINGEVKLRITSKGKVRLVRDFPFLKFQSQKWDRKWRIVTFDIPVKFRVKRDRLRRKLKELGFGMLQQSIWISPHNFEDDIREYLESNRLGSSAFVFVSGKVLFGNVEKLVNDLWKINEVNRLYKEAFENKDKERYLSALSRDPFLPKELLPKNWWAIKAKSVI